MGLPLSLLRYIETIETIYAFNLLQTLWVRNKQSIFNFADCGIAAARPCAYTSHFGLRKRDLSNPVEKQWSVRGFAIENFAKQQSLCNQTIFPMSIRGQPLAFARCEVSRAGSWLVLSFTVHWNHPFHQHSILYFFYFSSLSVFIIAP